MCDDPREAAKFFGVFLVESEHFDIRKCFFTMDGDTLYCMAVSV